MEVSTSFLEAKEPTCQPRQAGSAMVEMAIILPVILLILFAGLEFGVVFVRWQTLSNAAREGARTAIVFRDPCDTTAVETEVDTTVVNYAASAGITLAPSDVVVNGQCGGAGTTSTVSVASPTPIPILNRFTGMGPNLTVTGTAAMRNEG
jgi:Flp pilus assembly protein TadG